MWDPRGGNTWPGGAPGALQGQHGVESPVPSAALGGARLQTPWSLGQGPPSSLEESWLSPTVLGELSWQWLGDQPAQLSSSPPLQLT